MRNIFAINFLIILLLISTLQSAGQIRPLKIGDKVPNIYLAKMLKYKKNDARLLSDFGGKMMIIDTWNTHCAPCIELLPVLDSIAKENKEQLSVLLSDKFYKWESKEKVERWFANYRPVKNMTLPTSVEDSVMWDLTPPGPCQLWINKTGIVVAVTTSSQVTRENVKRFLAGDVSRLNMYTGRDPDHRMGQNPMLRFDYDYNGWRGMQYTSYIGGYDSIGINPCSYVGPHLENGKIHFYCRNADIINLYSTAWYSFGDEFGFKPYQVILHVKDSSRFQKSGSFAATNSYLIGEEGRNNTSKLYNYELFIRDTTHLRRGYRYMQQDLDRYFALKSRVERMSLPCYIIRRINISDTLSATSVWADTFRTRETIRFRNAVWIQVLSILNNARRFILDPSPDPYVPCKVIDETGYGRFKRLDVEIPSLERWNDLDQVNAVLKKNNLRVSKEFRKVDVLILQDDEDWTTD